MEKSTGRTNDLIPLLRCKDHTVSGDYFELKQHEEYEMLVTAPVPEDLAKYYKSTAYISHTDSRKTFFDKVYQIVKNHTLQQKLYLLNSFKTSAKSVLDVGAGTGDFLSICKNNTWTTLGVEPSAVARGIAKEKGIYLKTNLSEIKDQQFDVISLWHVLEHVENLKETIIKLKSLLKPGGVIVVAVPNYKSNDAQFYKEYWAAYDVPRHLWHFSQKAIASLFAEVEMTVAKIVPMKFDSYYVSLLSEKYKTGIANPIVAFYRGFVSNVKARSTLEYSSLIYIIKND
jgi:2-polyprenyl-3-methyl-5-hydroxy-6-metoxy-1,4-benzoquinol methylase